MKFRVSKFWATFLVDDGAVVGPVRGGDIGAAGESVAFLNIESSRSLQAYAMTHRPKAG